MPTKSNINMRLQYNMYISRVSGHNIMFFICSLFTMILSVDQTIQFQIIRWLMKNDLETTGEEAVMS
jgi:hypothetical protein